MNRSFKSFTESVKAENPVLKHLERLSTNIANLLDYKHYVSIDVWASGYEQWPDVGCITIEESQPNSGLDQFELHLIRSRINNFIDQNLRQYLHAGELADEQTVDGTQCWSWRLHAIRGITSKDKRFFEELTSNHRFLIKVRH